MENIRAPQYLLKITLYFFSIIQGILYTPIILSFVAFIIIIPLLITGNNTNALLRLLPSGQYNETDIISLYGKYAFIAALIISIAETVFKKDFEKSVKKKALWTGLILLLGYGLVAGLLVYRVNIGLGAALVIMLSMFIVSALSLGASALLQIFSNFISRLFRSE